MVFYCGVIKCNFYFIDSVVSVSPSPRYIPMPPSPFFHVPRSSSIKLTVPQAWIIKIAQPNYLMAPNLPCSSLFTFKGFISIFMESHWYLTQDPAPPVPLLSLLLAESAALCLAVSLEMYWVYQNLAQVATPDGNVRVLEIHSPTDHPSTLQWCCEPLPGRPFNGNLSPQALEYFTDITQSSGHVWDFQFHLRYPIRKRFPV